MNDRRKSDQVDRAADVESSASVSDATTQVRDEAETLPPVSRGAETGSAEAMPERFGRYRIVKELGRGGMGSVYLAEDCELQRQVALKIPKFAQDDDPELLERFYREARAAATLSHSNVCQVYDIGEHEGTRYISMAYISGPPLSKLVGSPKLRSERTIAKLVRRIALGLAAAHGKGILHRDLKPGNILLNERNDPVITDFGLARRVESGAEEQLTQVGMLLGTPGYMSPEQIGGDPNEIGPASDVYSLGVILYELLTGERPFKGPVVAVIGQIVQGKPKRPSELRPNLDKRLEVVCLKMMASSVDKRYASANEAAAALSHYLEQTAADEESSVSQAAGAQAKLEEQKQHTIGLLRQGKFQEAAGRLQKLAGEQGAGAEPYAKWATAELVRLKAMPKEAFEKGAGLVAEAIKLLAEQDFARVIGLLEAVPQEYRSPEAAQLLKQAKDMAAEADQLNERMKQAVHDGQYDGLRENVLERLLELEPGNLMARDIYEHLGTYGPDDKLRFDKTGMLLPAHGKYWWLDRLAQLIYQRLTRRRVQHAKPGARRKGEPVPAEESGPDIPVVALSVGLGSLCVLALLLGIIFFLRHAGETVKVEIDPALAEDAEVTVWMDGKEMEIAGIGETIKLKPGEHGYEIRRGNEVIAAREFTVLKDDNMALRITLDTGDHQALLNLAQRERDLWVQKAVCDDNCWEDCFVAFVRDQTSPYVDVKSAKVAADAMRTFLSSVDEVVPYSDAPHCEAQGAIGLIRWDKSVQFLREGNLVPCPPGLIVAQRRNGQWKKVAGIAGDWRLSPSDQYDPNNADHVALQQVLDKVAEAVLQKDAEMLVGLGHPKGLSLLPDWAQPEEALVVSGRAESRRFAEESFKHAPIDKYKLTITAVKVQGPLAVTVSRRETAVGDHSTTAESVDFYGRTKDGWRSILWPAGEWGDFLMAEGDQDANRPPTNGNRPRKGGSATDTRQAPPLAIAPFDAAQAKQHQRACAEYLGLPVEMTNSVGMKFVLIPPGEFMMGSPESERGHQVEEYQHRVRITKPFWLGTYEVTQQEYERVMGKNPSSFKKGGWRNDVVKAMDTSRFPVENVFWEQCSEFCRRLSELAEENQASRVYQLPTEAQWEYACRAGTITAFYHGSSLSSTQANCGQNLMRPTAVGSYEPNAWGLFDMHGNVWEWCQDWYDEDFFRNSPTDDPIGPTQEGLTRVIRGASYGCGAGVYRSAYRRGEDGRHEGRGFRVALEIPVPSSGNRGGNSQQTNAVAPRTTGRSPGVSSTQKRGKAPSLAIAPFDAAQAKQHQRAWAEHLAMPVELANSVGMKLVLIPPGEFMMGSSEAERQLVIEETRAANHEWAVPTIESEKPQHRVKITQPYYLGKYEVTQAQWQAVMGSNPSEFKAPSNPVDQVTWEDIQPFLAKLNTERKMEGMRFGLPTEAQWEYACRAGTATAFYFGDDGRALGEYEWYIHNSDGKAHPTGQKKPNAWGLYDMHGNQLELCADWHAVGFYRQSPATDPVGPPRGRNRVCRGGGWNWFARYCRSATRKVWKSGGQSGFRVALVSVDASRK